MMPYCLANDIRCRAARERDMTPEEKGADFLKVMMQELRSNPDYSGFEATISPMLTSLKSMISASKNSNIKFVERMAESVLETFAISLKGFIGGTTFNEAQVNQSITNLAQKLGEVIGGINDRQNDNKNIDDKYMGNVEIVLNSFHNMVKYYHVNFLKGDTPPYNVATFKELSELLGTTEEQELERLTPEQPAKKTVPSGSADILSLKTVEAGVDTAVNSINGEGVMNADLKFLKTHVEENKLITKFIQEFYRHSTSSENKAEIEAISKNYTSPTEQSQIQIIISSALGRATKEFYRYIGESLVEKEANIERRNIGKNALNAFGVNHKATGPLMATFVEWAAKIARDMGFNSKKMTRDLSKGFGRELRALSYMPFLNAFVQYMGSVVSYGPFQSILSEHSGADSGMEKHAFDKAEKIYFEAIEKGESDVPAKNFVTNFEHPTDSVQNKQLRSSVKSTVDNSVKSASKQFAKNSDAFANHFINEFKSGSGGAIVSPSYSSWIYGLTFLAATAGDRYKYKGESEEKMRLKIQEDMAEEKLGLNT